MESARANAPSDGGTPRNATLRILIVEDSDDCAKSMAMLLRFQGHEVRIARNGAEALDAARAALPDVVLLDIGLPGMNGYKVAEQFSVIWRSKPPFLVAVTGFGQTSDRQHSSEAGIDVHLVKPVALSELQTVLAGFQQLIHSRAQRRLPT